jgi:hypothetical protein
MNIGTDIDSKSVQVKPVIIVRRHKDVSNIYKISEIDSINTLIDKNNYKNLCLDGEFVLEYAKDSSELEKLKHAISSSVTWIDKDKGYFIIPNQKNIIKESNPINPIVDLLPGRKLMIKDIADLYISHRNTYGKFIKARVRRMACSDDPPQFKDMWRCYRKWHNDQSPTGKCISENEFKIRLNEQFQVPADGNTYLHLRLFHTDEDTEEYDKENDS